MQNGNELENWKSVRKVLMTYLNTFSLYKKKHAIFLFYSRFIFYSSSSTISCLISSQTPISS